MKTEEEIQKYRKATAEALELIDVYYEENEFSDTDQFRLWQPDKDANQMLMVWEWLKDRRPEIMISIYPDIVYYAIFPEINEETIEASDKDIKLATMKAFMEYTNAPAQQDKTEQ